jgi:DMSO reductase anchor subunit
LEIRFIPQEKQTVWKRKAALNFILGGGGAGFYLSHTLTSMLIKEDFGVRLIVQPEWLSILLVSAGLVSVALEAGRPWRARYVLSRLSSSWMSREALLAAVFMLLCILQWQWPHSALQALCAACAAGLMAAQGFLLYASRAVPAWNSAVLPPLMMVSSFYAGCGLNLINHSVAGGVHTMLPLAALVAGIVDWGFWRIYRRSVGWFQTRDVDRFSPQKRLAGSETFLGHLLLLGLVGLCMLAAGFTEAVFLFSFLAAVAGVGIFLSSALCKYRILSEMGNQWEIGIHC